jgi:predicted N-acyltransferase
MASGQKAHDLITSPVEEGGADIASDGSGPHKVQRGYMPTPTYSAHYIRNRGFRRAVAVVQTPTGEGST